jgi:uncharacterized protein
MACGTQPGLDGCDDVRDRSRLRTGHRNALARAPTAPCAQIPGQSLWRADHSGCLPTACADGGGRWPSELSLKAAPWSIFAGLVIGASMFSVVMAASIATGLYDFSYHGPASAWRGASLALESGILEEVIVRGVVLRLVWRAFGPIVAFVVSGLLFGAGHIANPGATLFTTACVAIEAGVMLGSFYALRGRLWVSIGVHAGWNFTQGYIFGALVSGGDFGASLATSTPRPGLPTWLTGGAFGPEASVPAFAVCSTVGAVVLWLAWRGNRVPRKAE